MADRYNDRERRRRDFERGNWDWDPGSNREWEQRLNRMRSNPSDFERDPYRNFNRGIGDDRQWDRDFNRGPGFNQDWDQDEYNRGFYNRGSLDRSGSNRSFDRDWERGGYNRGGYNRGEYNRDFDRGWEYDTSGTNEWDPETVWTYRETWWVIPGPFTGMGPSGYQRSDERILEDVNERLTQHGQIDASNISVGVTGGVVLLQGFVNSRREKRIAEDTAESVSGVVDIDNQLRVQGANQGRARLGGAQRSQIGKGMEVVDSNGQHIGAVKEVRGDHFIVDRPLGQDLSVPFNTATFTAGLVQLNVPADQVENLSRRTSEKIETPAPRTEGR